MSRTINKKKSLQPTVKNDIMLKWILYGVKGEIIWNSGIFTIKIKLKQAGQ